MMLVTVFYMVSIDSISSFLFELGTLKHLDRQGWNLLGISNMETVAAHSLRAAQIGYILAKLEHYDQPEKIVTMLVFHDIGECRIADIHKVANKSVLSNERKAVIDQLKPLGVIGDELLVLWNDVEEQNSIAGIIAKDADLLEMAVTAFELKQMNISGGENWIENTKRRIKTKSAKQLFKSLENGDSNNWWRDLKKI